MLPLPIFPHYSERCSPKPVPLRLGTPKPINRARRRAWRDVLSPRFNHIGLLAVLLAPVAMLSVLAAWLLITGALTNAFFTGANWTFSPVRVYVGLRSAPIIVEQTQLLLDERIPTGTFERKALVLASATPIRARTHGPLYRRRRPPRQRHRYVMPIAHRLPAKRV